MGSRLYLIVQGCSGAIQLIKAILIHKTVIIDAFLLKA